MDKILGILLIGNIISTIYLVFIYGGSILFIGAFVMYILIKSQTYVENYQREIIDIQRQLQAINSREKTENLISTYNKEVFQWRTEKLKTKQENLNYQMEEIDEMSGIEFEYFIARLLEMDGYDKVEITKASADDGVDLIAYKNKKKIAIQCKRYKANVSNSAVQQVYSGKDFYKCDDAYVITNSYFTKSAQNTAFAHNVSLIDRDTLIDILNRVSEKNVKGEKTSQQFKMNF